MSPDGLDALRRTLIASRPVRFLASGAFNTAATYGLYLVLIAWLPYRLAYTASYASGIVLAYGLNRFFVFRAHRGARSVIFLPFVYLLQYGLGMLVLYVWIEVLGLSEKLAPLVAIILTIPSTYLLSRVIFAGRNPKI